MATSTRFHSVNKCENQRPKAMQPATKQSTGLFLSNLLLVTLAKFGASSSSQVPYRSKPLLFMRKAKVICRLFHCSSSPQKGFRLSGDPDVGSSLNKK